VWCSSKEECNLSYPVPALPAGIQNIGRPYGYVAIGQLKLANNFIQIFSSRKVNICMPIYNYGIKYLPKTIVVIKS